MRITKFNVIIFIFFLSMIVVPQIGGNEKLVEQSRYGNGPMTTQEFTPGPPPVKKLNASIPQLTRNVTVLFDAKVSLEDEITLKIHDNVTEIGLFNYTVPTRFAKQVQEVKFFSQFNDKIGLDDKNNSRSYSVYMGKETTTYTIDIRENGFAANDSLDAVYIKTLLIALDIVDFTTNGTGQRGVFYAPITPMIPNIPVDNALIGVGVSGSQDVFQISEIPRFKNKVGAEMPIIGDVRNTLDYTNMTRKAYNDIEGMIEGDEARLVFVSSSPIGDQEQEATDVVPTAIKNAERIVRVDPWGKVYVVETIEVIHLGGQRNITDRVFANVHRIAGLLFTVDNKAVITDVYDELGSLEMSQREKDTGYVKTTASAIKGKQDLRIDFRSAIYGGQTYTFTIAYQYNGTDVLSKNKDTNQFLFNTTLFSDFNTTIWNLNVVYQLPAGATFVSHTYVPRSRTMDYSITTRIARKTLSSMRHVELVFSAKNAVYVDNTGFTIYYEYKGLGHLEYFVTLLLSIYLFLGLIYLFTNIKYSPSKAVEIEKKLLPIKEMDQFFVIFREKITAENRLAELRGKRRKGKISQRDYEGKVKAIRRRLREINPELEQAAKALSSKGGKYEKYVTTVMIALQRQTDIRRNMSTAKKSYEKEEIPKDIYQRMISEYNKDLRNQEGLINKTLSEMAELIQKYNQ